MAEIKRVNVAIPGDLHGKLQSVSKHTGISIKRLVRDAVDAYLRVSQDKKGRAA